MGFLEGYEDAELRQPVFHAETDEYVHKSSSQRQQELKSVKIKCDRLKPTCHACKKALRPCNYANAKIKDIEFQHITGTQPKPQLEDSWTSVLNHQLDISNEEISIFPQKPSWIMAEEEEVR